MARANSMGGSAQKPNSMILRRTLFLLIVCGIVAFLVIGVRLFQVQVLQHDFYEGLAVEQQMRETTITASRGTIYDRNMNILAMSASVSTIYISPAEIKMYEEDIDLIARTLSSILGVTYESVAEKAGDTKSWYKTISRKVEDDVADQIREFKVEYNIIGVKIEEDTKRYYPYGTLASHIIGYVGTDNYGLNGIELVYDGTLTGENGRVVRATNSAGTDMLYTNFEDYYDAVDGNDMVLTVDSTMQYYLEKHLEQAVENFGVKNGAAGIIMNVNTAEILAMASLGNFNLNDYQAVSEEAQEIIDESETQEEREQLLRDYQNLQWRNKALSDSYEPGSTFKVLTLAMALEEGVVSLNDSFYCSGHVDVLGRNDPVKCWKTIGHGSQSLVQCLQHSCNVAFVNIGMRVGAETFYKYAKEFGFFEKTGIDLNGEAVGIWWEDEVFLNPQNLSQLAAASFGQTFNITPMQLITAISACVNGGNLMQPYLISEVIDSDGNTVSKTEPTVVRQVISKETSEIVCYALEQVVGDMTQGTGKNAYVAGYRIGGKTGTSEKVAQDVAGGPKEYIVSFIGVAPMDDPEIAVLILLDTPDTSTAYVSGGQMAAPTVGAIMADALPYLGIEPVYTEGELERMDRTVPSLTGLSINEAAALLSENGLTYRVVGDGELVTAQLPAANAIVAGESQIILYAGSEPSGGTEQMIDLTNLTYDVARERLSWYGLFIRSSTGIKFENENALITQQSIPVGTMVEYGTVIEVTFVDNSELGRY